MNCKSFFYQIHVCSQLLLDTAAHLQLQSSFVKELLEAVRNVENIIVVNGEF